MLRLSFFSAFTVMLITINSAAAAQSILFKQTFRQGERNQITDISHSIEELANGTFQYSYSVTSFDCVEYDRDEYSCKPRETRESTTLYKNCFFWEQQLTAQAENKTMEILCTESIHSNDQNLSLSLKNDAVQNSVLKVSPIPKMTAPELYDQFSAVKCIDKTTKLGRIISAKQGQNTKDPLATLSTQVNHYQMETGLFDVDHNRKNYWYKKDIQHIDNYESCRFSRIPGTHSILVKCKSNGKEAIVAQYRVNQCDFRPFQDLNPTTSSLTQHLDFPSHLLLKSLRQTRTLSGSEYSASFDKDMMIQFDRRSPWIVPGQIFHCWGLESSSIDLAQFKRNYAWVSLEKDSRPGEQILENMRQRIGPSNYYGRYLHNLAKILSGQNFYGCHVVDQQHFSEEQWDFNVSSDENITLEYHSWWSE